MIYLFMYVFIYPREFKRERESTPQGEVAEWEGERNCKQTPHWSKTQFQDLDVTTWAETKGQPTQVPLIQRIINYNRVS